MGLQTRSGLDSKWERRSLEVWKREVACSDLLSEMIPCCVLNTSEGVGDAGDDARDAGNDAGDAGDVAGDAGDVGKRLQHPR